jgi:signal transduction histidine kinase
LGGEVTMTGVAGGGTRLEILLPAQDGARQ